MPDTVGSGSGFTGGLSLGSLEKRDSADMPVNSCLKAAAETEEDRLKWFGTDNYVKFLTDHVRSVIAGMTKKYPVAQIKSEYVNIIEPISVDRCRVKFDFFFDFENMESWQAKLAMRRGVAKSHVIQDEDIKICESTQKGMNSMTWKHGRYSSLYEKAVYDFHVLLWHELRGYQKR